MSNNDYIRLPEIMAGDIVWAMATGRTYDTVIKYGVHAHPAVAPYPHAKGYLAPIRQGGAIEYIYKVEKVIECKPESVYTMKRGPFYIVL